jgi:puromycin-sensitive aminopeptidase
VPLTLCCSSYDISKKFILKSKSDTLDVDDLISHKKGYEETFWMKLNIDQTGFYRVKYDDELAAGLKYAIQVDRLSLMDKIGNFMQPFYTVVHPHLVYEVVYLSKKKIRYFHVKPNLEIFVDANVLGTCYNSNAGIIDDASALSVACKVSLSSLLSLLDAYSMQSDYAVLSRVISVCISSFLLCSFLPSQK